MKTIFIFFITCGFLPVHAQLMNTLVLNKQEAEHLLLSSNLALLSNQLNIDKAEAAIIQARVWPNPVLELDEINLWTTTYQKKTGEELPALFGSESFGKFRQISARVEQLVETAGKRRKRIAMAEVEKSLAHAYLEDFLLNLKIEFRKLISAHSYHQEYLGMLQHQFKSMEELVDAYQRQYEAGNINKYEVIRLRSIQMQLKDQIIDQQEGLNHLQTQLIVLLNLPEQTPLSFTNVFREDYAYEKEFIPELAYLQSQATIKRPDVTIVNLDSELATSELAYERALRTPDVAFSLGYDRGGNILQDFVGVGFSMDLPFFDRNKGGIRRAEINVAQTDYGREEHLNGVRAEVVEKYNNLLQIREFFTSVDLDFVQDLDLSIEMYTRYFKERAVSMLEFLDFLEAYMDNKQIILENQKQYLDALEELHFATGLELELKN